MSKEKQNIKLEKVDDKTAYENLLIKYAELENKIADIKANCDLAIEGRDIKIKELEKENEMLKGDLELWESGGCRATNLFKCGVVKELKEQIEKMKCCSNCKHFNKEDDLECCQNCERQLVNSLDNLSKEEIIKDEWEIEK